MVREFLPEPWDWIRVDHWANYRGKYATFRQRVEAAEAAEAFRLAFVKYARRRKLDSSVIDAVLNRSQDLEASGVTWPLPVKRRRPARPKVFQVRPPKPPPIHLCSISFPTMWDDWDLKFLYYREGTSERICMNDPSKPVVQRDA